MINEVLSNRGQVKIQGSCEKPKEDDEIFREVPVANDVTPVKYSVNANFYGAVLVRLVMTFQFFRYHLQQFRRSLILLLVAASKLATQIKEVKFNLKLKVESEKILFDHVLEAVKLDGPHP